MLSQKRAEQYSLSHWLLVHSLLLDVADARVARAAYLLRHNTMTSNYYIIIPGAGSRWVDSVSVGLLSSEKNSLSTGLAE